MDERCKEKSGGFVGAVFVCRVSPTARHHHHHHHHHHRRHHGFTDGLMVPADRTVVGIGPTACLGESDLTGLPAPSAMTGPGSAKFFNQLLRLGRGA
ncbi:hypothetical protein VTO42DRAFT_5394 [Malbranchea cinnamomea]